MQEGFRTCQIEKGQSSRVTFMYHNFTAIYILDFVIFDFMTLVNS